jgi:predicted Rossmann-fold nucleotide-binding protein
MHERGRQLQFEPVRRTLYGPAELYDGLDLAVPASWVESLDFRVFAEFVANGGSSTRDPYVAMLRSMHDSSLSHLTAELISGKKVVAIMGGHKLGRDDPVYPVVAALGRELAHRGFLVTSGGGPGAMEAAHLGAFLVAEGEDRVSEAVRSLRSVPEMPDGVDKIICRGEVDMRLAAEAHRWFAPALEISASLSHPGPSLAVPTWHYGHEPSTPLATHIAKLFQNSIREDGLLAIATHGVVYARGKAGTVQEIFQDAAQNYYRSFGNRSSPMVLFGSAYWTEELPVVPVLRNLFGERFDGIVCITDDVGEAVDFIVHATPVPSSLEPADC